MCNIEATVPEVMGAMLWERHQSGVQGQLDALPWPSDQTNLALLSASPADPVGNLVSVDDAPSFFNFYTAAAAFFWAEGLPRAGQIPSGVVVRDQDLTARIDSVRIEPYAVKVTVSGHALNNVFVELASDSPGQRQPIVPPHDADTVNVTFTLHTAELPSGAWLLLRCAGRWIDRRYLTLPYSYAMDSGVEVAVDPRSKLEAFVANREGPRVEFKLQVPKDDDSKLKAMKTVCAFANGDGGSLLFGISDEYELVGLPAASLHRVRDQLSQMVDSWLEPRPTISFDDMPVEGTNNAILELLVVAGTRLYGCGRIGAARRSYIRHDATTVPASPAEIEAIVRARTSQHPTGQWGLR